ncbi:MAG: class I adenylate-forming enzyme family protein, partial [Acidobacteriota bacterium]
MNDLFELLASRARARPDAALCYRGADAISNREAHDDATALAAQLRRDRTTVLAAAVGDPYELHRWVWASRAAPCTLALLPVVRDPDAVKALMAQVGAERLVTDVDELAELASSTAGTARDAPASPTDDASPPAFLLQTSGTTGAGKWVAVRERQILTVLDAMHAAGALRHAEDQVVYVTPPLSHSYGLSTLFEYTKAGGAVIFPRGTSPLGPAGELRAPELAERVTAIEGVSDFHAQLSRLLGRIKLPELRHVGFGGGKIDADALARFRKTFPALTYSVRYGMTETPS